MGAGPYRFVAFSPGVELTLEAFEGYWRKPPTVKRLVFRVVPDEATRLAGLKRGEVDVVYSLRGALADEVRRSSGLAVKPVVGQFTYWYSFVDQWDPSRPGLTGACASPPTSPSTAGPSTRRRRSASRG